jgi:hypothetical protein
MLKPGGDDVITRLEQTLHRQVQRIGGVAGEYNAILVRGAKKPGQLLSCLID